MVRSSFKKCCIGYCLDGMDDYAIHESEGALDSCSDCSDECIQNKGMVSSEIWTLLCLVSASNMRGFFLLLFSPECSKLGMRVICVKLRYPKKKLFSTKICFCRLLPKKYGMTEDANQRRWFEVYFLLLFLYRSRKRSDLHKKSNKDGQTQEKHDSHL